MNQKYFLLGLISALLLGSCTTEPQNLQISSPNCKIKLEFRVNDENKAQYQVSYHDKTLIDWSGLGFEIYENKDLMSFEYVDHYTSSEDESWSPVWGQFKTIRNHYNELVVKLYEPDSLKREINIFFRVFDDGVGFRYEFPGDLNASTIKIKAENTAFNFLEDMESWWIPADWDSYERLYTQSPISDIKNLIETEKFKGANEIYMKSPQLVTAVNTPITMKTKDGIYISIHEADLTDYPEMTLEVPKDGNFTFKSALVPWGDNDKIKAKINISGVNYPFKTPWRTIQIAEKPGDLVTSNLILNLNDIPSEDFSWVEPIKYMGIWWGYHIGAFSWDPPGTAETPHGATTERSIAYIDFCSENGIKGLLIEGWSAKMDPDDAGISDTDVSNVSNDYRDYMKPHPDFDLEKVAAYAKEKGVEIVLHNETMGQTSNYESQIEKAFAWYEELGIHYLKTGYAWYIDGEKSATRGKEYHHGQRMVEHYQKVVELAAKHKISICVHEPIKATGKARTYPNMLTREGVRGNEYNAWVKAHGNPPEHTTILPFTRGLGGPIDFTPGTFDLEFDKYRDEQRVNTTLSKQLSLFVIIFSPLQMANDLYQNYIDQPAFKWIQDVPCTWDDTKVLDAAIGDYVVIARQKDEAWYLGAITDEEPRNLSITLDFLEDSKEYQADIYEDSEETNFDSNPTAIKIRTATFKKGDVIEAKLCKSGGIAVKLY